MYTTVENDFPERVEHARASLDLPRPHFDDGGDALKRVRTDEDYDSATNISSDVDYLRAREGDKRGKHRAAGAGAGAGGSKHHNKRASLGIPGTKILSGRFGDAFRRFEGHGGGGSDHKHRYGSSPSSSNMEKQQQQKAAQVALVSDSEATQQLPDDDDEDRDGDGDIDDDNDNDDGEDHNNIYDETSDDISPEMRRELERRKQSQEEKRVANAAAEYRRQVTGGSWGRTGAAENARSSDIQNRVQNLLQGDNNNSKVMATRTATGYGRYTDATPATTTTPSPATTTKAASEQRQPPSGSAPTKQTVTVTTTAYGASPRNDGRAVSPTREKASPGVDIPRQGTGQVAAAVAQAKQRMSTASTSPRPVLPPRPAAPPKPKNLRVGGGLPSSSSTVSSPVVDDDWETSFSRRYPSLSKLEMVETEIKAPKMSGLRTREV